MSGTQDDGRALHLPPVAGLLPGNVPTLVLLNTQDPELSPLLDAAAASAARVLDLRSGIVWAEVPDGRQFISALAAEFVAHRSSIRVAFAAPDATLDHLLASALCSVDLAKLAVALDQAELALAPPVYDVRFQPVVHLGTQSVIGFESLIRASAGGVPVDTTELLARAERGGWLSELDQFGRVLALRAVGEWFGDGLLFLNVLAPGGIFDVDAAKATVALASRRGIEPDQLVFEITERNRYSDLDAAAAQIEELRALGVRIAVDDVGDGYASLLLVSRFRPDVVKISGRLIRDLPRPEACAVVTAVVQFAHQTGTWVVAEGIERIDQAQLLGSLGVDWGQGHFLGLPAPLSDAPVTADRPLLARS